MSRSPTAVPPTTPAPRSSDSAALDEAGRGLDIVTKLCTAFGAEGDHRGRVVWAQFRPTAKTVPAAPRLPMSPQPATNAAAAAMAQRYTGWHTWYGPWTRRWWALDKRPSGSGLISEPTAAAAVSSDRSNSGRWNHGFLKHQLREHFAWLSESDYSTRTVIKRVSDRPEIIHVAGYFCPFREVFPDEPVGVLVGAALPW